MALPIPRRSGVGILEVFGPIGSGAQVAEQARLLEVARTSKHIKALLLDIDSPGGSVGGSELLHSKLERVAKTKPIVTFIRGLGASGGYYLSCATNRIVTLPSSLVGSIGVIYVRPALQDLLQRIGVSLSIYKGGRLKDMSGFWRSPTSEEDHKMEGIINEIHDNFIRAVARGRNMNLDEVRKLATGEVFTGHRAMSMGLVDEIGDFDRALELAAELGKSSNKPLWLRPKRTMAERLAGQFGHSIAEGVTLELDRMITGGLYYKMP